MQAMIRVLSCRGERSRDSEPPPSSYWRISPCERSMITPSSASVIRWDKPQLNKPLLDYLFPPDLAKREAGLLEREWESKKNIGYMHKRSLIPLWFGVPDPKMVSVRSCVNPDQNRKCRRITNSTTKSNPILDVVTFLQPT